MNVLDYVKVYQLLSEEECDKVLNETENYQYYRALTTKFGEKDIEPQVDKYRTNKQTVIPYGSEVDTLIYQRVALGYSKWMDELPQLEQGIWRNNYRNVRDTGYEINKYDEGEYYDWHIDILPTKQVDRILSLVLYLNDDYEGGELQFPFLKYTPKKGYAILFPSNWMFPHTSLPIKTGTKYSLVTWMVNDWKDVSE